MHRVPTLKRLLPEIFNPHIKPQSLLIKKAACAYSTDSIHGEIDDHTVKDDDEFQIPTTDLDDSKYAWDIIKGSRSLSSDLVLVHLSLNIARQKAGYISPHQPQILTLAGSCPSTSLSPCSPARTGLP
jgi:hypothetical protein